jgi:hypothetical protein
LGAGGDGDSDSDSDSDSDGDGDGDGLGDDVCAAWDVEIEKKPPRLMILQDRSSSMTETVGTQTKWDIAINAVDQMVSSFDEIIEFGIDFFSEEGNCSVSDGVAADTEPNNGPNILDLMIDYGTDRSTPLYLGLQNFQDPDHAPRLFSDDGIGNLVVISDGQDSCGQSGETNSSAMTPQDLANVTSEIAGMGIAVIVIGFGNGVDPDQLNAIAQAGGSRFQQYMDAQDEGELEEALDAIASTVVGCLYGLGDFDETEVDMNEVNFYFDGEVVGYDENCAEGKGWTWFAGASTKAIEFCEEACEMLNNNEVEEISAEIGCPTTPII